MRHFSLTTLTHTLYSCTGDALLPSAVATTMLPPPVSDVGQSCGRAAGTGSQSGEHLPAGLEPGHSDRAADCGDPALHGLAPNSVSDGENLTRENFSTEAGGTRL